MNTARYTWTIGCIIITPILLAFAFFSMGAGHGSYIPTMLLFPFGMAGLLWQQSITFPFIVLGFFQLPVYGLIIDKWRKKGKTIPVLIVLLAIHLTLAILIIKFNGESFS